MWRLATQKIKTRSWDEQSVIFNVLTGGTHLVQPVVLELLELFRAGPKCETEIARILAEKWSQSPEDLAEWVHKTLLDLSELYLVERDE